MNQSVLPENRITLKDILWLGGLLVIFVTLILTMYMIDRQWLKLADVERLLGEQMADLRSLHGQLKNLESKVSTLSYVPTPTASVAAPVSMTPVTMPGDPRQLETSSSVPPAFQHAWQASQQSDYAEGDWLVHAFSTDLKTITPLISSDAYASEVQSHVLESLLTRDPETLAWQGLLAESWKVSDDGLTITFQLRPEAIFSDGAPLTAEDVAFTYRFIMDPKIAAPRTRAYLEKIDQVTATHAHEVVFHFKEPYFDALALAGGTEVLARHFYEPYLKEPEKFNQSKGLLLGSGPYRLASPASWTPDQGLVELERNPRYWGAVSPPFRRILWKLIGHDSARLASFRNKEIDLYGARPNEYAKLKEDRQFMENSRNFAYLSPTGGYNYIAWNQSKGGKPTWFADQRVRQAMTYLTDRERLVKEILLGFAEVATSPFSPQTTQHDTSLKAYPYDVEKAKDLLKQAGFADRDGDGVIEDPQGKPFTFELAYFQNNEDTAQIVLLLKDLYAKAGILMKPKPVEWAVMLDYLQKGHFDAITVGWTGGLEIDIFQMFHSSQIGEGADNFIHYRNTELDHLMETARATVDEKKRMPLWHQCEKILHDDQPYTFLIRSKSLAFIDKRFQNVKQSSLGLNIGRLPVEIYVPPSQQRYRP